MIEGIIEKGTVRVSVSVAVKLHQLCLRHSISWAEAMRRGISVLLAERNVEGFSNELNDLRMKAKNLDSAITRLELLSQENEDLKEELKKIRSSQS